MDKRGYPRILLGQLAMGIALSMAALHAWIYNLDIKWISQTITHTAETHVCPRHLSALCNHTTTLFLPCTPEPVVPVSGVEPPVRPVLALGDRVQEITHPVTKVRDGYHFWISYQKISQLPKDVFAYPDIVLHILSYPIYIQLGELPDDVSCPTSAVHHATGPIGPAVARPARPGPRVNRSCRSSKDRTPLLSRSPPQTLPQLRRCPHLEMQSARCCSSITNDGDTCPRHHRPDFHRSVLDQPNSAALCRPPGRQHLHHAPAASARLFPPRC